MNQNVKFREFYRSHNPMSSTNKWHGGEKTNETKGTDVYVKTILIKQCVDFSGILIQTNQL